MAYDRDRYDRSWRDRERDERGYASERDYRDRDDSERDTGRTIPIRTGSQEFGPEGYGSSASYGWNRGQAREWPASERWRVPGPYTGRGPKGYQRSDERIREEVSDRLTAHGQIDASDIEVRVQGGEITLVGFVDSRDVKHAAEDLAEDIPGVREVHNQLRIRTHADDVGVGRTSVLGLTEHETQTAGTAKQADAATRSRARTP
jgi:hypothetical protein